MEKLIVPGGLDLLVDRIRTMVFPRASEEARELFRAGQKVGVLSRQYGESITSYISRRRRWWRTLQELDPSISLSESMRVELMLELSGLSRQECLVIKACTVDPSQFEQIAATLIQHYGSIHLRENSRTWNDKTSGDSKGNKGKGKTYGKTYKRVGYVGIEEEEGSWNDDNWVDQGEDGNSWYTGFWADEDPVDPPEYDQEDYEFHDEIDEYDVIALNAIVELDVEENPRQVGEVIQLQQAAFAAFGKAKGKGFSKKGKSKGKGKMVRSALSLDQRRAKLVELKARSKCLRCGGIGHWAGDPQCKFPGGKAPQNPQQKQDNHTAHFADMSDSSEEGTFVVIGAGKGNSPTAMVATEGSMQKAKARVMPSVPITPKMPSVPPSQHFTLTDAVDEMYRVPGSEFVISAGVYRGKTYGHMLHRTDYYALNIKNKNKSKVFSDFREWVDRFHEIDQNGVISVRETPLASVVSAPSSSSDVSRLPQGAKKKPPHPPKPQKCANCTDFTYQGSTGYTIRQTCRDCGHSSTSRRGEEYPYIYENCPHDNLDHRGSSRVTSRTFCKGCGHFIDEQPQIEMKKRVAISKAVIESPQQNFEVISDLVNTSSQDGLAPYEINFILQDLGESIRGLETVTPVNMHHCLATAIQTVVNARGEEDPNIEYVRQGLRDPEHIGYVATTREMSSEMVCLDLPVRHWDDPNDPNVYVALDEGCNTSCHSEHWGSVTEKKLKLLGLSFPWKSQESKTFTGLGSNASTTGCRILPFALKLENTEIISGILESHEVKQGKTPLLLSLYSQLALGLIKDLANQRVYFKHVTDGTCLPIYKCATTGLLLVNMTAGMTTDFIPKGIRKYRIPPEQSPLQPSAMTSVIPSWNTTFLQSLRGVEVGTDVRVPPKGHLKQGILVNLVSSGVRHGGLMKDQLDDTWSTWSLDVRPFEDPDHDPNLRAHVGRHIDILAGLLKHPDVESLMRNAVEWASGTSPRKQCVIELFCRSGRHRSVGLVTIVGYLLKALGFEINIVHQSAWTWREMRCGGRCNKCRFEHARSNEEFIDLMKPWVRKFSGMVSSGDVASGPSSESGPRQVTWRPTPRVESVTTRVGEPVSLRPRGGPSERIPPTPPRPSSRVPTPVAPAVALSEPAVETPIQGRTSPQ